MMDACGEAEGRLASELMQHELQLEKDIMDPVNHLAEVRGTGTVIAVVVWRASLLGCEPRCCSSRWRFPT